MKNRTKGRQTSGKSGVLRVERDGSERYSQSEGVILRWWSMRGDIGEMGW